MDNPNKVLFECQQMFRHACAFADCSDFALEKLPHGSIDIEWYSTPAIVNSAFACEVYLKALLRFYAIPVKKEHGLKEFFELLPEKTKQWIKQTVLIISGGKWTDSFGLDMLDSISNAFVEWRYVYEYSKMQIDIGFLAAFRNALREACCQLLFNNTWEAYKR